jgi:hypothetical protein
MVSVTKEQLKVLFVSSQALTDKPLELISGVNDRLWVMINDGYIALTSTGFLYHKGIGNPRINHPEEFDIQE